MNITITLRPEMEAKLRQRAAASGQTLDSYVEHLVERDVGGSNGGSQAPVASAAALTPQASLPSDEALAPFRRQVAESGMSDVELREFFEEVRQEVYQDKHGKPSQAP